ncbi:class I adenylate-forming enzyme family protein [Parendozoicomonas haliclonae]|uniref:2,3-dihydroxybenzoate-AMP ligase n=1 Tax=Parendozoicomonas haliclonae TaxID=1960125 RepID=A0A1X7AEU0_9GAMM|nr:class I adenylate-forming enzyme family protein [Parendozoicomonas haliclonae]SMA35464.1 2,3-dihydroxybenzoate-AMP ligase [Parendozoicomonas haliclonae]
MQTSSRESIEFYVRRGFWGEESLESLFRRTVAIHPGRLALIDPPDRESFTENPPRSLTYSDLFSAVRDVSAKLLAAGLKKDHVVVTQLPNTVETVILYLAVARIGALLCPVAVDQSQACLAEISLQLDPFMYVGCRYKHRDLIRQAATWLPESCTFASFHPDEDSDVISLSIDEPASPDQIRLLGQIMDANLVTPNEVFTLTWKRHVDKHPAIPRTHNQWFALASFIYEGASLRNGDALLCAFPLSEASGIGAFLYNWLMAGGRLVMAETLSPENLLQQIKDEKITCAGIPPQALTELVQSGEDLSSVRSVITGFAQLDTDIVQQLSSESGLTVLNCYGTSEGASLLTSPVDRCSNWQEYLFPRFDGLTDGWNSRMSRMVSTRLRVPGQNTEITEPGQPGELFVKGPSLFDHYYVASERFTEEDEVEHPFCEDGYQKTGDLFVIDEENPRFYRFVGRLDKQVS